MNAITNLVEANTLKSFSVTANLITKKTVIKVLKPVKAEKIYREIKILQTLYGGPNIIKLCDLIKEPKSKTPCFIYEYMPHTETKRLSPELTD